MQNEARYKLDGEIYDSAEEALWQLAETGRVTIVSCEQDDADFVIVP